MGKRWHFEGTNELNIELVNKSLYHVKINYSEHLYQVLREMLLVEYRIRPDFINLRKLIVSKITVVNYSKINLGAINWSKIDLTSKPQGGDNFVTNGKKYLYVTNGVLDRICELDRIKSGGCMKKNTSKLEDD